MIGKCATIVTGDIVYSPRLAGAIYDVAIIIGLRSSLSASGAAEGDAAMMLLGTMLAIAASTFVSEDLACIGAGVLAAQGGIGYAPAAFACFAGIFGGDVLTMLAGRWLSRKALTRAPLRWVLSPEAVDRSAAWFSKRETAAIFISRLLPGSRVATYFAAGLFSKRPGWIVCCLAVAAALWAPALVGASMLMGREFVERISGNTLWALLGAMLAVYLLMRLVRALATHRGRRMLTGTFKRWAHWEFWPMWLFYPPVIAYIAGLALRYRGLTFTACNPGITPASGIVGESKIDILRKLGDTGGYAEGTVARAALIARATPLEAQLAQARAFMTEHGLTYPIALKPDRGERGAGVSIARDDAALESHLRASVEDTVIQAYVRTGEHGGEYGVFYYRLPNEPHGRVFRITDKRMPVLSGDDVRTLEQLILDDPRAVAMARHYIAAQGARADVVIPAGERVQLVELGTHSRGSIFLDGTALLTPALQAAIDRVSKRFDGYFFGRYDIRTADTEAFRRGEGFQVIELNGVTSEATSIYDPRYSVFDAYRTLFEQWRIAFEIGAQNIARGAQPLGLRELWRLVRTRGRGGM
jgi:membrane protein DedA with SNARE-associated domain